MYETGRNRDAFDAVAERAGGARFEREVRCALRDLEELSAREVLTRAVELHQPRLVAACSFQKEETVLIDMLMAIEPAARVFTIDTGELFARPMTCGAGWKIATASTWRSLTRRA